jgi:PAS domain S-box-containing protein
VIPNSASNEATHAELEQIQSRLKLAMLATRMAIWDWDLASDRIEWNEGIGVLAGHAPFEVEPTLAWRNAAIHADDRARVVESLRAAIRGTQTLWQAEYRLLRRDGTDVHVSDRAYILREGTRPVRVVGALQDITERVRLLEAERRARAEAEAASQRREEVMAIVSHDLRNPLFAITTSASVLHKRLLRAASEQGGPPPDLKHLGIIERSAQRIANLIGDLLDVAAIESNGLKIQRAVHDVGALVRESIELLQPVAASKQLKLSAELENEPLWANVDRERVSQVLSNLLGNALKFTPEGGTIAARAGAEATQVRIEVQDSGPGISPEELPNLFDRFRRRAKGDRHGLGLGLSIAKGIVEAHGGQLWVTSAPGQGTTFFFSLPIVHAPLDKRFAAGTVPSPHG